MRKHKHFKFMGFVDISGVSEIHRNSETWENYVPIIRESMGKNKRSKVKVS